MSTCQAMGTVVLSRVSDRPASHQHPTAVRVSHGDHRLTPLCVSTPIPTIAYRTWNSNLWPARLLIAATILLASLSLASEVQGCDDCHCRSDRGATRTRVARPGQLAAEWRCADPAPCPHVLGLHERRRGYLLDSPGCSA